MKHYATGNVTAPTDSARQVPNYLTAPDLGRGSLISYKARYQPLSQALLECGILDGLGRRSNHHAAEDCAASQAKALRCCSATPYSSMSRASRSSRSTSRALGL